MTWSDISKRFSIEFILLETYLCAVSLHLDRLLVSAFQPYPISLIYLLSINCYNEFHSTQSFPMNDSETAERIQTQKKKIQIYMNQMSRFIAVSNNLNF